MATVSVSTPPPSLLPFPFLTPPYGPPPPLPPLLQPPMLSLWPDVSSGEDGSRSGEDGSGSGEESGQVAKIEEVVAPGGYFSVTGPCITNGNCVASPNYPSEYGSSQHCVITPLLPMSVSATAFDTEPGSCPHGTDLVELQ